MSPITSIPNTVRRSGDSLVPRAPPRAYNGTPLYIWNRIMMLIKEPLMTLITLEEMALERENYVHHFHLSELSKLYSTHFFESSDLTKIVACFVSCDSPCPRSWQMSINLEKAYV